MGALTGTKDGDRPASLGVVFAFSLGLGISTVVIPLRALAAGHDAATVGFLVAIAAGSGFATRLALPWLLGRWEDRSLIGAACLAMIVAFGLLVATTALPVFVLAQVFQGAGRAFFWTGSQAHAIRGEGDPVRRLVDMNVAGNFGTLVGPALGGTLALAGLPVALIVAILAAALAALGSRRLRPLPPFDRRQGAGTVALLRRDGVDVACWAAAVGGGWWAMLGSYVPVLAVGVGIGSVGVGWLVTIAEGAGMVALVLLRRQPAEIGLRLVRPAAAASALALVGVALAVLFAVPSIGLLLAVLMIVGGGGSGTTTTLAPALAGLSARPAEQGDALALTGAFRAGAMLAAPAIVGALVPVAGIPAAIILVAAALGLPGTILGRSTGGPAGASVDAGRER